MNSNRVSLHAGDCLDVLRTLDDCSVDSVVTDPPYGLSDPPDLAVVLGHWLADTEYTHTGSGFMSAQWDSFVPGPAVWRECLRVLKPGGHLLAFAGSRTHDLMGTSIRLAGFEIRDAIMWVNAQGMPKGMDLDKAIAKKDPDRAGEFEGWRTALKPAHEPITVARKPLDGTVINNVMTYGTGGLNIDSGRVQMSQADRDKINAKHAGMDADAYERAAGTTLGLSVRPLALKAAQAHDAGRFPTNLVLSHAPECGLTPDECVSVCPVAVMDAQSGQSTSKKGKPRSSKPRDGVFNEQVSGLSTTTGPEYDDAGGASRFFPVFRFEAKALKVGRPVIIRPDGTKVAHTTVKPLDLMRWLVRLVTPPGGIVLDPFAGSGTTVEAALLEGFSCVAVEREPDYVDLVSVRVDRALSHLSEAGRT